MTCLLDPLGGSYVARAEAKLAELGPGRLERLELAAEEAFAHKVVLTYLANHEAAEEEAAFMDALAVVMDRLHRRGAPKGADDDLL